MTENTESTTRKPRTQKMKVFHVNSPSGIDAYFYAPTTAGARAAATASIEVREVEALEFADLIRNDVKIHGLEDEPVVGSEQGSLIGDDE